MWMRLSITSAAFCWPKGREAAQIQGAGGADSACQWAGGTYLQGGRELVAAPFGDKL